MKQKSSLTIATAPQGRAAIAAAIAVSFYSRFRLAQPSELVVTVFQKVSPLFSAFAGRAVFAAAPPPAEWK